ncbi:MAG: FHA domain-containing protein [Planctomycetota bacterium]|nr:FHA domain-containing protein [Planctomycetota bacterium]
MSRTRDGTRMSEEDVIGYWLGAGSRPFPVRRGETITLGRDSQNSVMLFDAHASRRHAEVFCNARGEVFVIDLGSSNGTYLNDGRMEANKPSSLRSGDNIRIGGKVFTFISNQPGLEARAIEQDAHQQIASMQTLTFSKEEMAQVDSALPPTREQKGVNAGETWSPQKESDSGIALAGSLTDQNLAQIMQFLNANGRTGELLVKGHGLDGNIAFEKGQIFRARAGVAQGDEAVFQCARLREGTFQFKIRTFPPDRQANIATSTMNLVFECCRQMDDESRGAGT